MPSQPHVDATIDTSALSIVDRVRYTLDTLTTSELVADDVRELARLVDMFAHVRPLKGSTRLGYYCPFCKRDFWSSRDKHKHDPKCDWLVARRASGLRGDV